MIDAETIRTWRINYGLDARSPAEAMRWWSGEMHGCAPAGAVAALGICLDEIERLRSAINWACGYDEGAPHFGEQPEQDARYAWRHELRRRAGMPWKVERREK